MLIVDAHVHAGQCWFQPVETVLFEMQRNGVAKAVLIQFWGNYDNRYVMECVRKNPGRFVAAVLVDTQRADAPDTLEKLAAEGAVGVRLRANDPPAVWRKASELGLVVSGFGTANLFAGDEFRRLVEELPDLKIVLEHLAGAELEPQTDYTVFQKALTLAKYPNIYIKLPGFGELLPRPVVFHGAPFDTAPRVVRMAYEAFGRERMMWGSNFSSSAKLEGYTNALRLPIERTPFFSQEDKEWIFGKTALSVWKMA